MESDRYTSDGFDPQTLKVSQLKEILSLNDIKFHSHDKKDTLIKTFKKNIKKIKLRKKKISSIGNEDDLFSCDKLKSSKSQEFEVNCQNLESNKEIEPNLVESGESVKYNESSDLDNEQEETIYDNKRKRDQSEDMTISLVNSTKRPKNADIGQAVESLITNKIQCKKSPAKSPHRSLIIDKFESSQSSESDDEYNISLPVPGCRRMSVPLESNFCKDLEVSIDLKKTANTESTHIPDKIKTMRKRSLEFTLLRKHFTHLNSEESNNGQISPSLIDNELIENTPHKDHKPIVADNMIYTKIEPCNSSLDLLTQESEQDGEQLVEKELHLSMNMEYQVLPDHFSRVSWSLSHIINVIIKLFTFMLLITPILFSLWYREQKILIGYCGHEVKLPTFSQYQDSKILETLELFLQDHKPTCLPCPTNAICYPYMKIKCEPDYLITHSQLSLYGLIPISDYCVKDLKKEKRVQEVIRKSLDLLRTKNTQIECGDGQDDIKSGMSESDLYEIFYESRSPWINDEEFNEIWKYVVQDLKSEPEIIWRQLPSSESIISKDTNNSTTLDDLQKQNKSFHPSPKQYFRLTSKKYIGLRCQFEAQIYKTYRRFKFLFWSSLILIILYHFVKFKLRKYFQNQEKVDRLVELVVEKLKQISLNPGHDHAPKFLSIVQLRDVLLHDITNLKEKNRIWDKVVQRLNKNNTNVKSSLVEIHGEIMKCWEWVGPLD